jgi:hypothetical protein
VDRAVSSETPAAYEVLHPASSGGDRVFTSQQETAGQGPDRVWTPHRLELDPRGSGADNDEPALATQSGDVAGRRLDRFEVALPVVADPRSDFADGLRKPEGCL